ncbi:MAG: L-serine ammonia-lyase, iron-sulfur-dependent, subunit alpha, partial [Duncaniella sp.]|nr:L-serine ammonia-lyase, iron-sulfur-dependent, subunit alpha [Duncaniella sp.]
MLSKQERDNIISLIHREVVPAMGCTEPVAVSLAVAKATELLGCKPERIEASLSGNIIKNAMGVGIPGTGMIGLPIAIALGALIGKSEYELEVLRDVNPEAVAKGKEMIASGAISVSLAADAPSNLHIDITVKGGGHEARAVISCEHTQFVRLERDGEVILDKPVDASAQGAVSHDDRELDLATVWEFASTTPLDEIRFILQARDLNLAAANHALAGDYGHSLGATIRQYGLKYYGDTPVEHMISYTSAACDARMGGAPIAVMSNSGSGNQGITATMPVVSFANDMNATEEQTIRALTLSHL